jgi:hypothetical protein
MTSVFSRPIVAIVIGKRKGNRRTENKKQKREKGKRYLRGLQDHPVAGVGRKTSEVFACYL